VKEALTTFENENEMISNLRGDFPEQASGERNLLQEKLEELFDVVNLEDIAFECEELVEKFADLEQLKKQDQITKQLSEHTKLMDLLHFEDDISSLDDSYEEEKEIQEKLQDLVQCFVKYSFGQLDFLKEQHTYYEEKIAKKARKLRKKNSKLLGRLDCLEEEVAELEEQHKHAKFEYKEFRIK